MMLLSEQLFPISNILQTESGIKELVDKLFPVVLQANDP